VRIAITGGTGFVGRHIARRLTNDGHEIVLIARGRDATDPSVFKLPGARFCPIGLDQVDKLSEAFAGCDAIAHCAGINRELGAQNYRRVHVEGTQNVVDAARKAGARKIALISFLRARPNCGSGYHESKWAAEEIVRDSGLDYTIFKCGVIYGKGDHMLDHLSHAFHTFPVFALVGFQDKPIRPTAVEDVVRIVVASLVKGALARRTVAVLGPEQLTLATAVRRVARVVDRKPLMFPLPVWFHYLLACVVERVMTVPMVSWAQVRILSEGIVEPSPPCDLLPPELASQSFFTDARIRQGLPAPGPFSWRDVRCCHREKALPVAHNPTSLQAFLP
jgi:NADH dehydrogenase